MKDPQPRSLALMLTALLVLSACGDQGKQAVPPPSQPPFPGLASPPAAGWPTYHRDLSRSGVDPTDRSLFPAHQAWASAPLDGEVYAEPLVIGDQFLVATEGDSVYALDATTGQQIWRSHLGEPVTLAQLPCGDIDPVGITSTPVADPEAGLLWVVPFVQPGRHELVALELATGAVRLRRPINPPQADPLVEQQRGALAISRGMVYVPFGGLFGDCGAYNGWVVGVPTSGNGALISYRVPASRRGGIWAPSGPAVDAGGDLFVATGNTPSSSTFDFGNAVIRLAQDLHVLDWFAPTNWADLNAQDLDLGSMGPTLLADDLVFQAGKDGTGYLLRADHLGGIGGQVFAAAVCTGAFGGTAYAQPYIYVPCRDGLVALRVGAGPSFTVAWRGPQFWAGPPIVSGGAVWTIARNPSELYALDPNSGQVRFRQPLGSADHFVTPAAAGGRVVVAAGNRIIAFSRT